MVKATPTPVQAAGLSCPAFELLMGGSKGWGKTFFLAICPATILQVAHEKFLKTGRPQRKCRVMVFRKNLDDLKDFLAKTFEIYPLLDPKAEYNKNEKTWTFESGATIELRHLDGPNDHLSYNGNEFVALLFDEVNYISYDAYRFLVAQVRSSDPDYQKLLMVRSTANPGGPHGDWVKAHFFVDRHPKGGKIIDVPVKLSDGTEMKISRAFIRASLKDNPHLPKDYEAQLRATMNDDEVRMFIDGDFDVVAGAFFSSLIKPSVHFVDSRPITGSWDMIFGMDWGSASPAAWYLGSRDPDGRVYIIDELHEPGVTGRVFGEKLVRKFNRQTWSAERKWKVDDFYGVIDKQAMDNYGSEATAADGIASYGFRIFEAKKDRKIGINQIKERLLLDEKSLPRLIIFKDRCPKLVEAIKSIRSLAPKDPDDYDSSSPHSHALDGLRFLLMEWPLDTYTDDSDKELSQWEALMRKRKSAVDDRERPSMTTGYGD